MKYEEIDILLLGNTTFFWKQEDITDSWIKAQTRLSLELIINEHKC